MPSILWRRRPTHLGGTLLSRLPWIVAVLGTLFTLVAAIAAEQLVRGRRLAEQLAIENQALYGEQRGIAQTLQRALLPEDFPDVPGLGSRSVTCRVPSVSTSEVTGTT